MNTQIDTNTLEILSILLQIAEPADADTARALGFNPTTQDSDRFLTPFGSAKRDSLLGKKVAITGDLSLPREIFRSIIDKAGGRYSSCVSSRTDYLILGDNIGQTGKLKKAKNFGTSVVSERTIMSIISHTFETC